jgi:FtsZ-interacting cell division protein ZipA
MRKQTTILGAVLFVALLFTSCSKKAATESTTTTTDTISTTSEMDTTMSESTEQSATVAETPSESSSECDQFIKDYRDYVNSYIKIMKKYKKNPSDPAIMAEYTEMAQKANAMQEGAGKCTDPKYSAELLSLAQKMAAALQ